MIRSWRYRTSVPGMLESIFAIVDEDKDQKLNHPEFATFIKHSKGQVLGHRDHRHELA